MRIFTLVLLFYSLSFCATRTASTCGSADVASAIALASTGDTIVIPSGIAVWDTNVTVTKKLKIRGQTTTTRNATTYQVTVGASDSTHIKYHGFTVAVDSVRITGITYSCTSSTQYFVALYNGMTALRIDHCNFASGFRVFNAKAVAQTGLLFDNNYVRNTRDEAFYTNGTGNTSWYTTGGTAGKYNPDKCTWFEDNAFVYDSAFSITNPFDMGEGARATYRHNYILMAAAASPTIIFEAHGHCWGQRDGAANASPYFQEVSNNKVYKTLVANNGFIFIKTRGGRTVAYGNELYGTAMSVFCRFRLQEEETGSDVFCGACVVQAHIDAGIHDGSWTGNSTTYPLPQQHNNSYIWGNSWDNGTPTVDLQSGTTSDVVQQNREYWTDLTAPDGEAFGSGVYASRPASPTAKDCYWATDSLILYKCVSNGAWVEAYASYPYPHTARSQGFMSDSAGPPTPSRRIVKPLFTIPDYGSAAGAICSTKVHKQTLYLEYATDTTGSHSTIDSIVGIAVGTQDTFSLPQSGFYRIRSRTKK